MRLLPVLLVLVGVPALAYPIPPQTIWELSARSERIVVAHVDRVEKASARDSEHSRFDDDVAVLSIQDTWKGSAEKELRVSFTAGLICPAPPRFIVGARVVAFLSTWEGVLGVTALSYGTRYPVDDEELGELRSVTQDAIRRQRSGTVAIDEVPPPPSEWALKAVAGRSTRWDGLYSLDPASDPRRSFYDRTRASRPPSDEVLQTLERAFIASPSVDSTLPVVLRLLAGRKSAAFDQAAVDAIDAMLRQRSALWWDDEAITLLEARLGTPPPAPAPATKEDAIDSELANLALGRENPEAIEERIQKRWAGVKARHGLKPSASRELESLRRLPVGGDTTF